MRWRMALLAVLVTLAACKKGSTDLGNPNGPSGTQNQISIIPGAYQGAGGFSPTDLTVTVGTTISFKNNDSVTHDPFNDQAAFNSTLEPGQVGTATLNNKGVFTYHCGIHPQMSGTITVQ